MAQGELDLQSMLESLAVTRRPGTFAFVTLPNPPATLDGIEAIVREDEGYTVVTTAAMAQAQGWAFEFEAAWLTLQVHSALEAVGLTAAVANTLASAGIACNVVAAYYHDHLLVPHHEAQRAVAALEGRRH